MRTNRSILPSFNKSPPGAVEAAEEGTYFKEVLTFKDAEADVDHNMTCNKATLMHPTRDVKTHTSRMTP